MKLVGFPILRPLTFKCKILTQFESLKIIKDLYAGWQSLPPSSFFPFKSWEFFQHEKKRKTWHFNVSNLKIEILLISSCSFDF